MPNSIMSKVIVVTGANKGIGKAIVKQLVIQAPRQWKELDSVIIYLTARNSELGLKALNDLKEELKDKIPEKFSIKFNALDISSQESISKIGEFIKKEHGGLDILLNNAGIASKGSSFDYDIARKTIDTNYYGTLNMMKEFLPLMKKDGRIINVSSIVGCLKYVSEPLKNKLLDPKLTITQLTELMEEFINSVKDNTYEEKGWPRSTYGVSKISVTGLSKIYAHEQQSKNTKDEQIIIRACHPGYVNTDMTSGRGPLTVDEGAATPVHLSIIPKEEILNASTREEFNNGLGVYWSDKAVCNW